MVTKKPTKNSPNGPENGDPQPQNTAVELQEEDAVEDDETAGSVNLLESSEEEPSTEALLAIPILDGKDEEDGKPKARRVGPATVDQRTVTVNTRLERRVAELQQQLRDEKDTVARLRQTQSSKNASAKTEVIGLKIRLKNASNNFRKRTANNTKAQKEVIRAKDALIEDQKKAVTDARLGGVSKHRELLAEKKRVASFEREAHNQSARLLNKSIELKARTDNLKEVRRDLARARSSLSNLESKIRKTDGKKMEAQVQCAQLKLEAQKLLLEKKDMDKEARSDNARLDLEKKKELEETKARIRENTKISDKARKDAEKRDKLERAHNRLITAQGVITRRSNPTPIGSAGAYSNLNPGTFPNAAVPMAEVTPYILYICFFVLSIYIFANNFIASTYLQSL
jgi:hypothetical protein